MGKSNYVILVAQSNLSHLLSIHLILYRDFIELQNYFWE